MISEANYRPFNILRNLSKIFERVLLSRMTNFIDKHYILPDHQFSFRANHSTKDAIFSLMLKIEKNLLENKKTCCIFLDFSKAFDTVHHETLLSILHSLGFRGHFYNILADYLSGRHFRVKLNGTFSQYSPISQGVPQGSIISPLLYCLCGVCR